MPRGRRKASFVGSPEWRKQDVDVTVANGWALFKDKPTGMSIKVLHDADEERAFAELAHRIKQLTF